MLSLGIKGLCEVIGRYRHDDGLSCHWQWVEDVDVRIQMAWARKTWRALCEAARVQIDLLCANVPKMPGHTIFGFIYDQLLA